jgi:hypothetical protein
MSLFLESRPCFRAAMPCARLFPYLAAIAGEAIHALPHPGYYSGLPRRYAPHLMTSAGLAFCGKLQRELLWASQEETHAVREKTSKVLWLPVIWI